MIAVFVPGVQLVETVRIVHDEDTIGAEVRGPETQSLDPKPEATPFHVAYPGREHAHQVEQVADTRAPDG